MAIDHDQPTSEVPGRRQFLRVGGGLAVAGFLAPGLAGTGATSGAGRARSCILVYLLGGPPQLDTFDLKPEAPAEIRGEFRPISTRTPGLSICEHLPRLARLSERFAVVRSVSYPNSNHTPMIYYTLTGRPVERPELDNDVRPPQRTDDPHLGGVLARLRPVPPGLPGFVAIPDLGIRSSISGQYKRARTSLRGGGGGFLGPLADPLGVDGDPGTSDALPALGRDPAVNLARLERRTALLNVLERRQPGSLGASTFAQLRQQAVALTGSSRGGAGTFKLDDEPAARLDRYGRHRFGRSLILARRLAEAGVPMVAIHFNEMTVCDGWDTHAQNFAALREELLPMVDQGLSALIEDLGARGLIDETLIVMMGEFGRTPRINKDAGRDHWGPCQSALLAGGGIQGGRVLGSSDRIGAYPASDPVDPVDIHATIYQCLGLDPGQIIRDHLGRPYPLSTGRVLDGLL